MADLRYCGPPYSKPSIPGALHIFLGDRERPVCGKRSWPTWVTGDPEEKVVCLDCLLAFRQRDAEASIELLAETFWSLVDISAVGCWSWIEGTLFNGYGRFGFDHKSYSVHVLAYELAIAFVPDGMEVHHNCRNRACVNPDHLLVMTKPDHMRLHHGGKTHCKYGHLFDEANTRITKDGWKHCRTCHRLRMRKPEDEPRKPQGPARLTHCKRGHPFDEANTMISWVRPQGKRLCRTCYEMRKKKALERDAA